VKLSCKATRSHTGKKKSKERWRAPIGGTSSETRGHVSTRRKGNRTQGAFGDLDWGRPE